MQTFTATIYYNNNNEHDSLHNPKILLLGIKLSH